VRKGISPGRFPGRHAWRRYHRENLSAGHLSHRSRSAFAHRADVHREHADALRQQQEQLTGIKQDFDAALAQERAALAEEWERARSQNLVCSDLERAWASVRNVSTEPRPREVYDPAYAGTLSDVEHRRYVRRITGIDLEADVRALRITMLAENASRLIRVHPLA